jgi:hypothetical protein
MACKPAKGVPPAGAFQMTSEDRQSFMRLRKHIVIASCFIVSALEVFWHWFIATSHSHFAETQFLIYTSRSAVGGKGFFPVPDLLIPALALGVVVGRVGREWRLPSLLICIALVTANVVALTLLYPMFFATRPLWWVKPGSTSVGSLTLSFCETAILVAFASFMGMVALARRAVE